MRFYEFCLDEPNAQARAFAKAANVKDGMQRAAAAMDLTIPFGNRTDEQARLYIALRTRTAKVFKEREYIEVEDRPRRGRMVWEGFNLAPSKAMELLG